MQVIWALMCSVEGHASTVMQNTATASYAMGKKQNKKQTPVSARCIMEFSPAGSGRVISVFSIVKRKYVVKVFTKRNPSEWDSVLPSAVCPRWFAGPTLCSRAFAARLPEFLPSSFAPANIKPEAAVRGARRPQLWRGAFITLHRGSLWGGM